ncbi:putative GTP-binding protein 6 [Osmia lignaria lignaria]|uniref:putative GTP-binding protein 6 n=1 Tax=Osmia lignaria lignaria TaxID=1437193 RepID=UPI00402B609D
MQYLKQIFHVINKSQYVLKRKKEFNILNVIRRYKSDFDVEYEGYEENDEEKRTYMELSENCLGSLIDENRVFVIQPYIKWGRDKKRNTTPELQLAEAIALINTLPNWKVIGEKLVPLLSLQRKQLVGSGALDTLKKEIRNCIHVRSIFVSTNLLKFIQISELQKAFDLPVYDRYSIVIHIFRQHAHTPEAKLQVALAELPYIRKKMIDFTTYRMGRINLDERRRKILQDREKKLRNALEKLKQYRELKKTNRNNYGFPSIAVVGYTNAGKTSLIKALTGDARLQPENKLFATLDTTVHQGFLSNKLKVLYVDTIGFIQDVPETLIEPFTVTLRDAINADILIHIFDISHPDIQAQIEYVQKTIRPMIKENKVIINVANKCDIIEKRNIDEDILPEDTFIVSSVKSTGIDELQSKIEEEIMTAANLLRRKFRVKMGSPEASLLYKETAVMESEPDPKNVQYLIMDVVVTTPVFYKLQRIFRR